MPRRSRARCPRSEGETRHRNTISRIATFENKADEFNKLTDGEIAIICSYAGERWTYGSRRILDMFLNERNLRHGRRQKAPRYRLGFSRKFPSSGHSSSVSSSHSSSVSSARSPSFSHSSSASSAPSSPASSHSSPSSSDANLGVPPKEKSTIHLHLPTQVDGDLFGPGAPQSPGRADAAGRPVPWTTDDLAPLAFDFFGRDR